MTVMLCLRCSIVGADQMLSMANLPPCSLPSRPFPTRRQPAFEWIYGWRPGDAHDPPKLPNRIASPEDEEAARAAGAARAGRKRGLKPAGGSTGGLASGGSVEPPTAKRSKSAAELSAEAMAAAAAAGMAPMGMAPFGMPMAGARGRRMSSVLAGRCAMVQLPRGIILSRQPFGFCPRMVPPACWPPNVGPVRAHASTLLLPPSACRLWAHDDASPRHDGCTNHGRRRPGRHASHVHGRHGSGTHGEMGSGTHIVLAAGH